MGLHPTPGLAWLRAERPDIVAWAEKHTSDVLRVLQEAERESPCYWTHDDVAGWVLVPGCYAVVNDDPCTCSAALEGAADALFRRARGIEWQVANGAGGSFYFGDPVAHLASLAALRAEVRRAARHVRMSTRAPDGVLVPGDRC